MDYNTRLQPEDMRLGTTQDGSQVWRSRLSYDPAGGSCAGQAGGSNNGNVRWQEVTAPIDAGGSLTLCQTYGYDAFNRLTATQEVGSWSRTNSYDAFGNRTVNVGTAQTISPSTNQITAVAGYPTNPPDYDDAGNMIFHPQIGTLAYDAENRQTSFSFSGKTGTYVYDGEGHRIKRVSTGIGGSTALFVYDAFDRLAAEYAPTAPSGAAQTEYRTADHLGSTRVVTDATQAVVARRDFYPFGGRIENTWGGRTQIAAYAENPGFTQRFTAKERDGESNLDYFLARYYASSLGRFTSADPVQITIDRLIFPQQLNRYAYTQNNPLVFVDPTGLDLELAGNVQGGTGILCDIVGQSECGRISVDAANQVTFNTKGLDLSKNEGAALVADLVGSSAKFQFSVGNSVNTAGGPVTITDANGSGGIINLDNNPDIRLPGGKVSTALPPTGVGGLVGIDPNARPRFDNGGQGARVPTSALAFHELSESFAKVDQGLQYLDTTQTGIQNRNGFITIVPHAVNTSGAHSQAIQRELILRSQRPSLQRQGRAGGSLRQP